MGKINLKKKTLLTTHTGQHNTPRQGGKFQGWSHNQTNPLENRVIDTPIFKDEKKKIERH